MIRVKMLRTAQGPGLSARVNQVIELEPKVAKSFIAAGAAVEVAVAAGPSIPVADRGEASTAQQPETREAKAPTPAELAASKRGARKNKADE